MKYLHLKKSIAFILLFFSLLFVYVNFPAITNTFDNKLKEYFFEIRGEIETTNNVVIIDIDEKSISQLGQWPFSRDYMAQVLVNLTNSGVGIIGLDIIFSEYDRSSPSNMAKILNLEGEFQNNDELLGQVIANTPTILGYFFSNDRVYKNSTAPIIPAQYTNKMMDNKNFISSSGVVTNIPPIQNMAYSSGFFNAFSSGHGKITKMPLLLSYKDKIYPSLTFEMIRIATNTQMVDVIDDEFGIKGIKLNNLFIPTDKNGFLNINFRGAKKSFKYISFVDILTGDYKAEDIEGKFVLIGTSAITLADLRATVYDLAIPGVEIHANIIDNILKGDFIQEHSSAIAINTISIFILTVVLGIIYLNIRAIFVIPVFIIFTSSLYYYYYHLFFMEGTILNIFYPLVSIILTTILAILINYSKEQKQKNFIKGKFAKKVSPAVVNDLLKNKEDDFKGIKKELSIFFSDIRGFTPLSEKLNDPQELIKVLNMYMEPMAKEIIETNGTIDKFIGDAIMAYWNAPQDIKNHADCAVQSALKQLEALEELNKVLKDLYDVTIDIGIGIHTGIATVGEMGSSGRSDYTIIGDNVNLASRVESLCKLFGAKIIITQETKNQLTQDFPLKELASVIVKGKSEDVVLYEVLDKQKQKKFNEIKELYNQALIEYENMNFKEAKSIFIKLNEKNPETINQYYIDACNKNINIEKSRFLKTFILDSK